MVMIGSVYRTNTLYVFTTLVSRSPQMCTRKYDQFCDPFRDGNPWLLRSMVTTVTKKMADSRERNCGIDTEQTICGHGKHVAIICDLCCSVIWSFHVQKFQN
jgi:hypothetical protein